MKIRTKILLYIVLPIFAADTAITVYNSLSNYDTLKTLSESKFVSDTELIASKISAENARGVAVAKTAAEGASVLFGRRAESVALVRDILAEFPMYIGASVGYEVNADLADFKTEQGLKNLRDGRDVSVDGGVDAYGFAENKTSVSMDEWIAKSEGGRFVAYWSRAKGELTLEPLANPDTAMYSAGLRKKMESGDKEAFIVTEPYLYSNNVMMVEYSAPVYFEGKFSGQVAFDRDLASLSSTLSSMKTLKGEDIFLISAQGRIISATKNENLRTLSVDDLLTDESGNFTLALLRDENGQLVRDDANSAMLDSAKYKTVYRDMLKSAFETSKNSLLVENLGKGVSRYRDPQTRRTFCVSQSLIRPGNWVVVHVVPEEDLFAPLYASLLRELCGAAVFFAVMAASLLLAGGIVARIGDATRAAEEIAKGNFLVEFSHPENVADETGSLLRAVGRMASKLRAFASRVRLAGVSMEDSVAETEKTAGDYDDRMRDFGAGASAVFAEARQLGESAERICETADALSESAADGARRAAEGRRKIPEIESTLGGFARNTSAVSRRLAIISERMSNVNTVITAISKVAEETNLLSLNASIEAEKAGAAGVGFAVVAREVGRLAEQTAAAADDIENIVKDTRTAVASGVSEMEKFSDEVRAGGAEISRIISEMDDLAARIQTVAPHAARLAENVRSQRAELSKMSDTMSGLDDILKRSAVLRRGIVAGGSKLREASERLSSALRGFGERGDA